jgi:hypothetical protein
MVEQSRYFVSQVGGHLRRHDAPPPRRRARHTRARQEALRCNRACVFRVLTFFAARAAGTSDEQFMSNQASPHNPRTHRTPLLPERDSCSGQPRVWASGESVGKLERPGLRLTSERKATVPSRLLPTAWTTRACWAKSSCVRPRCDAGCPKVPHAVQIIGDLSSGLKETTVRLQGSKQVKARLTYVGNARLGHFAP